MSLPPSIQDIQDGYPAMARIMGSCNGMMMFKRFRELNARNLLYLQAEILDLEQQLKIITSLDETSGNPNRKAYARDGVALIDSKESKDPDNLQYKKLIEIREKLKEYDETLLRQDQVSRLKAANPYDLSMLEKWLREPLGGNNFLTGFEATVWTKEGLNDLVTVSRRDEHDVFIRWISEKLVPWFHGRGSYRFKRPVPGFDENLGLVEWKHEGYLRAARAVSVMISTLFPSVAVIVLYFIKSLVARLGVVLAFSAVFAITLAVFTNARPVEIFAATAACASVQVVFVGSTSTNGTTGS